MQFHSEGCGWRKGVVNCGYSVHLKPPPLLVRGFMERVIKIFFFFLRTGINQGLASLAAKP